MITNYNVTIVNIRLWVWIYKTIFTPLNEKLLCLQTSDKATPRTSKYNLPSSLVWSTEVLICLWFLHGSKYACLPDSYFYTL